MPPPPRGPLACALLSAAYALLGRVRKPIRQVERVRVADERHTITIVVQPIDESAGDPQAKPGLWLSPLEALIVRELREAKRREPGKPILGKNIATLVGKSYDGTLRAILANLVEREILTNDDDGYSLAATAAE